MAKRGQMLPYNGSGARMFFTPLKGGKINQIRICDGNLCGPQSLKYLLSGSLQIKFAGGTAQQNTGKQTGDTQTSHVNCEL